MSWKHAAWRASEWAKGDHADCVRSVKGKLSALLHGRGPAEAGSSLGRVFVREDSPGHGPSHRTARHKRRASLRAHARRAAEKSDRGQAAARFARCEEAWGPCAACQEQLHGSAELFHALPACRATCKRTPGVSDRHRAGVWHCGTRIRVRTRIRRIKYENAHAGARQRRASVGRVHGSLHGAPSKRPKNTSSLTGIGGLAPGGGAGAARSAAGSMLWPTTALAASNFQLRSGNSSACRGRLLVGIPFPHLGGFLPGTGPPEALPGTASELL